MFYFKKSFLILLCSSGMILSMEKTRDSERKLELSKEQKANLQGELSTVFEMLDNLIKELLCLDHEFDYNFFNQIDINSLPDLHLAIIANDTDLVRDIINSKVDFKQDFKIDFLKILNKECLLEAVRQAPINNRELRHFAYNLDIIICNTNQVMLNVSSALNLSILLNRKEIIKLLLEAGADTNEKYKLFDEKNARFPEFYAYPLHLAILIGDIEVIKLLVKAGADINKEINFRVGDISAIWEILMILKDALNNKELVSKLNAHYGLKFKPESLSNICRKISETTCRISPLCLAILKNDQVTAKFLVQAGAMSLIENDFDYFISALSFLFQKDVFKDVFLDQNIGLSLDHKYCLRQFFYLFNLAILEYLSKKSLNPNDRGLLLELDRSLRVSYLNQIQYLFVEAIFFDFIKTYQNFLSKAFKLAIEANDYDQLIKLVKFIPLGIVCDNLGNNPLHQVFLSQNLNLEDKEKLATLLLSVNQGLACAKNYAGQTPVELSIACGALDIFKSILNSKSDAAKNAGSYWDYVPACNIM